MTDLIRFKELYASFGIPLQEVADPDESTNNVVIWMESGDDPKIVGYSGFCTGVYFDAQGKFIKQGFWE